MKGRRIWALLILCLFAVEGETKLIQCYLCDDCDVLNDCLLQSCPHGVPQPPATSTSTASQTTPTTPPTQATTPHTTTTPNTATPGPQTSVIPTTSPIPATIGTPITTERAPSTGAGTIFTSETEGTSDSTTVSRSSTETDTTSPSPSTDAETQATTQMLLIRNDSRASFDTSVSYHCYSINVVENYKQRTKRGCVEVMEDESACGVLRKVYGCSSKNCKVCSTDGCNCNGALRSSLLAVAVIMLCGMISKTI